MTGYMYETFFSNFQEVAYGFLSNVLMETEGINLGMHQLRNSVESALSFIDELSQNLLMMAQGILVWFLSFL
jgi:centromeric protein E